eukprot:TRINITY_DN4805_c0_g1_i1.p1 TRINITY_DN4805_c0_g1~~TRINITY_DN4805_c0_g1_i1.p1  ORF type:complete len:175 (+),score=67.77 TRINITY_DN4805_c0_g1_i1:78-602(+)
MLRRSAACLCTTVGTAPTRHTGKCLCGTVKYSVEGTPDWVAHVHSTFYRQSHGASSVLAAGVVPKRFNLEAGEGYLHRKAFNSVYKHTCKKCGTHVYDDWLQHHKKVVFPTHMDALGAAHRLTADWEAFAPQFHLHYDSALQEDFPETQYFRYNGHAGDASWPPSGDAATASGA